MSLKAPHIIGVIALAAVATVAGAALWQSAAKAPTPNAPPPPVKSAFTAPAVTQAQPAITTPAVTPADKPAAPAATVAQAPTSSAPVSAGQQAHIDPKTGQLRPAEHDDVAQLNAKAAGARRAARTAVAEPQQFEAPGGGFGMAVPDEVQAYTVATKAPDGSIVLQHVTGPKQADAVVRANTAKAKHGMTVSKKEEPNDR
jgi:hypothetical protein